MSKVEQVTSFRYNGKLYSSLSEAKRAEAENELYEWLYTQGVGRGCDWDTDMFFSHLKENRIRYLQLLNMTV